MKGLGYGQGYRYAHNYPGALVAQANLPEELQGRYYYHPTDRGYEKSIKSRPELWRKKLGIKADPRLKAEG
jgi:putative ATPase